MVATLVWGAMTGHGLGGAGAPPIVTPFNETWQQAVGTTIVDGGLFFAIPVAWLLLRRERPILADLCLGAMALLVAGAVVWGARFGDFTMFHVFYGGIAVFGAPIAAVSAWTLWVRLRERGHLRLATGLAVLCLIQLDLGVLVGIIRMEVFGPHDYSPISVSLLNSISRLPPDAKLAYACQPLEEVGFGTPRLLSIDAHTGHRIVPMCFEAEVLSNLIGAKPSLLAQNLFFTLAPQRALYPDANADPSSGEVAAFLKDHGIHYIYADARHPNTLVVDAIPMASGGDAEVLRVP